MYGNEEHLGFVTFVTAPPVRTRGCSPLPQRGGAAPWLTRGAHLEAAGVPALQLQDAKYTCGASRLRHRVDLVQPPSSLTNEAEFSE